MAERRMFTKKITESDAFLDLPVTAQNLYFHLNMYADDRGIVANPRTVMRITRASEEDAKILLDRKFLIPDNNRGVVVIKHWKMHNFIAKDKFHETTFLEFLSCLYYDENKAYTLNVTENPVLPEARCQLGAEKVPDLVPEMVPNTETEVRLGKDSIGKDSIEIDQDSIDQSINDKAPVAQSEIDACNERIISLVKKGMIDYAASLYRLYKAQGLNVINPSEVEV